MAKNNAAAPGKQQGGSGKTVKVLALSVTAKRDGFRRAGRAWSKEATVVALADLTKEEIKQITNEPMLTVEKSETDATAAE